MHQRYANKAMTLTRMESNRLFSFTASYTFSGMNASCLRSLALPFGVVEPFGIEGPEVEFADDGVNSRRKTILRRISATQGELISITLTLKAASDERGPP